MEKNSESKEDKPEIKFEPEMESEPDIKREPDVPDDPKIKVNAEPEVELQVDVKANSEHKGRKHKSKSTGTRTLFVSNLSPGAIKDQVHDLFSYIGRIEDCKVYPSDGGSLAQVKFAYVKFQKEKAVAVAQYLTNTVFLDRALICMPIESDIIPDEEIALKTGGSILLGQRQLPPDVINHERDSGDGQKVVMTVDPTLTALGLPQYPPLPATTEPSKIEEIRRTVYIGNLDKNCDGDELMDFLNTNIGEVMYLRMTTGNDNLPCTYAYVEFAGQGTVSLALQNNGIQWKDRGLRIQHSRVSIIKPEQKTADQALTEVEEAIKYSVAKEKLGASGFSISSARKRSFQVYENNHQRDRSRSSHRSKRKKHSKKSSHHR